MRSRVKERSIIRIDGLSVLENPQSHYGSLFSCESGILMGENSRFWRRFGHPGQMLVGKNGVN